MYLKYLRGCVTSDSDVNGYVIIIKVVYRYFQHSTAGSKISIKDTDERSEYFLLKIVRPSYDVTSGMCVGYLYSEIIKHIFRI
jgi:hypothetical protein